MKIELSSLKVGQAINLAWEDEHLKPRPFVATVRQFTTRAVLLVAKYKAGEALELEVEIWMPVAWRLTHVRNSRNCFWLPKVKQNEIPETKLKRLI